MDALGGAKTLSAKPGSPTPPHALFNDPVQPRPEFSYRLFFLASFLILFSLGSVACLVLSCLLALLAQSAMIVVTAFG